MSDGIKTDIEEFREAPTHTQRVILFKAVVDLGEKFEQQIPKCNVKFRDLEKQKKWNLAASGGGGLVGGFLAMLGKIIFGK